MVDINNLISGVAEFAKSNRYRVEIFPPNASINGKSEAEQKDFFSGLLRDAKDYVTGKQSVADTRMVGLNCSAVNIPGVSYATRDIRNGSGPLTKMPYDKIYEPMTCTFYVDVEHNIRRFFTNWMNLINVVGERGNLDETVTATSTGINGNNFGFYNDYIGGMYVYQLDANQLPSSLISLNELYPTAVSEIALGYENANAIQTFTVQFTYRDWTEKPINRIAGRVLDEVRGLF